MISARPVSAIDATPECCADHNAKYLRNALLGNTLNLCAVNVPCGFSAEGLPLGPMIYAKPFDEATALRVAWAYEQATEWPPRRPDLAWAAGGG
jgi:aspartyl-tRNA(Asn)/glutamyl-tRNA(Gln) amidotransferase subunit A